VRRESGIPLTGHIAGLDGVRGVAILLVMASHFLGEATFETPVQKFLVRSASYGLVGVDLFFVLSGFLITGLLLDAKGSPHYFRNFYARRTLRIFPLYYFVLAVLCFVLPHILAPTPLMEASLEHQGWAWTYTTNFYLAYRGTWHSLAYISHFWSLAIEEQFYLFWPLVVLSLGAIGLRRVCLGVVVGALALRLVLALLGTSQLSISVLTPCRMDDLCIGALLALLVRQPEGLPKLLRSPGRAALLLGASSLGLTVFRIVTQLGLPIVNQLVMTLNALFFGALILLALDGASLAGRAFRIPVLRFLGKYSYGLYVYHVIFHWGLKERHVLHRLDGLLGSHALAMATLVLIGFTLSLGVSILSYELLEKRFLELKRFFPSGDQREARTAPMSLSRPTISTIR